MQVKTITPSEYRRTVFDRIHSKTLVWAVYAMVISYFYNLPVVGYSAKGNNELRLYDLAGFVLLIIFIRNYSMLKTYIFSLKTFASLYDFLFYSFLTLSVTFANSIIHNKFYYIFQTGLWYFHFLSFFLVTVFISILIIEKRYFRNILYMVLILGALCVLLVILQNFGLIPFLWSSAYAKSYHGFLSGTLGPNKIVVGMTCLFLIALCLGILNEKRFKVNKLLVLITLSFCLIGLVMSGSRTSYLGGAIMAGYYSLRQPLSFAYSVVALFFVILLVSSLQPKVIDKAFEVYNQRVTNKIKDPDDVKEANVGGLYEDLGAGRSRIAKNYVEILLEDYYYIPFGRGFNNRMLTNSSAHNMYLSLIYEVGLLGTVLYFRWLFTYLLVRMPHFRNMRMALQALTIAMLVSLLFGEHLYIYRPLFGLLGLFLLVVTLLTSPTFLIDHEE